MKTSSTLRHFFSHFKTTFYGSVLALLTSQIVQGATALWIDNGVEWGGTNSGYYRVGDYTNFPTEYDGVPNDASQTTPVWSQVGSGGTVTLHPTYFNITTSGADQREFRTSSSLPSWDASIAATVEFTVRVNSGITGIIVGNSNEWLQILLGVHEESGDLTINKTSGTATRINGVQADSFNTIRLTLSGMNSSATSSISIYLNNDPAAVLTYTDFVSGGSARIRFGDTSTSANAMSQSSDWQSIKWLSGQALNPIPEPASIFLLLGSGALLMTTRRRRH